jgi:DNA modification methylase
MTWQSVLDGSAKWAVVQGDCTEILPMLPDRSVDHCLSDPPYSKDLYARTRTNKGSGLRPNGRPVCASEGQDRTSAFQFASDAIGSIDDILDPVADELLRLVKRWTLVFHDIEIDHRWRAAFGPTYVRTGIWVKPDAMPQVTGDRPAQGFEACTIAHPRGRKRWNGGGLPAVWTHNTSKGHERPDHPCPKPLSLMIELVELFTDVGDLVIDPFAGSATTGVACLRLGRRFLGIERDPKFHQLSMERLAAEETGLTLRDARAGQLSLLEAAK